MKTKVRIQLLLTGNELMSGVTTDTNSNRFAEMLARLSLSVYRRITIGDDMELLVHSIQSMSKECDVLLVNGGLGPTIDDLSAEALGKAFNLPLTEHAQALQQVKNWCERMNAQLSAANIKQAILPEGVGIIRNPVGSAPGFYIEKNNCLILFTPGVPSELEAMLKGDIPALLAQKFPNAQSALIDRYHCFGIGESRFQQTVDNEFPDWPKQVELSFRAGAPTLEIKLTTHSPEHHALKQVWKEKLFQLFGDYFVSEGEQTLAGAVVALLKHHNKKVTFAESCTGGKIASMLTEVSGASEVFEAGFVTYSNRIKSSTLGVTQQSLAQNGAVSETVAKEMLLGALHVSGADIGAAVSGIAGPNGGSAEKPVGTVCIAWGSVEQHQCVTFHMPRSRQLFQLMVAATALDLIRRQLLNIKNPPDYFGRKIVKNS